MGRSVQLSLFPDEQKRVLEDRMSEPIIRPVFTEREQISYKRVSRVVMIDDSGWGFPLGGVLCGVHDDRTNALLWREIGVKFFQDPLWGDPAKPYLQEYAKKAVEMVEAIGAEPENTLMHVCKGFVNNGAVGALYNRGFRVKRAQIGDPLQSWLENRNKMYVLEKVKGDIYYDPKGLRKQEISRHFSLAINYLLKYNLENWAKTGWKYFKSPRFKNLKFGMESVGWG
ncbi:hypothetical protein HOD83_03895 [Candidatus Woesearchaeota archaeon]|jgi:hypothetical protein|nr:hypothetical protein [Candidatus Woesearchaeota archaeon]MBT4114081.1 hypothetical protein [Candidatus Woesearchaeota archaeon]MBT4248691.1 hypothetical protein [Candidatus Woesearchaeota archaeon]